MKVNEKILAIVGGNIKKKTVCVCSGTHGGSKTSPNAIARENITVYYEGQSISKFPYFFHGPGDTRRKY